MISPSCAAICHWSVTVSTTPVQMAPRDACTVSVQENRPEAVGPTSIKKLTELLPPTGTDSRSTRSADATVTLGAWQVRAICKSPLASPLLPMGRLTLTRWGCDGLPLRLTLNRPREPTSSPAVLGGRLALVAA